MFNCFMDPDAQAQAWVWLRHCLQVKVFVFSPTREGKYEWMAYKPQSMPRSKLTFPIEGIEKFDRPGLYHIELCHTFGKHFDRVVPQNPSLSVLQQEPQPHTFVTPPSLPAEKNLTHICSL